MIYEIKYYRSIEYNSLNEAVCCYSGEFAGQSVSIRIDGSNTGTNFPDDPYFKFYNRASFGNGKKGKTRYHDELRCARVFFKPHGNLIEFTKHSGVPLWCLTQDDKNLLQDLCKSIIIGRNGKPKTLWGQMLYDLENVTGFYQYYKQPDYTKLTPDEKAREVGCR